ncbi:MAG TPA: chemotaxis protein CheB [Thermoanaerobaculia bacterium]|jgi:two-component system CheB/CheR fusion protein|nr:chemotaxis protein CheB [Thermoanaerobaculia bacterium]
MTGLDQEPEKSARGAGEKRRTPCPIVGIGASAGGLAAFEALFSHMPAETGMAFVLVQHLDPRHETLMPELLAKHTAMPVHLVSEDTPIGTDCVYVTPPNSTVTIDECVLRLNPRERSRGRRMPIDSFFRSLAEDQGDDAVGIVLSGTGADGALGLRALREHGAMTMAQAPSSARYDSMPRSAIRTGMVDHVLPVEEMPFRLMEHLRNLVALRGGGGHEGLRHEVEENLSRICAVLRRRTGHDFSRYKQSTLVRRVRRRMTEVRTDSAAVYLELLAEDPREIDNLFQDLLIGVTHFFRDPEAFAALEGKVIPKLFEGKGADGQVRVWVPGCSTGEEAYSLAMLLLEHAGRLDQPPRIQIFATDIDAQALETARQAWYPEQIADQVAPDRLARFFAKHGNLYRVAKEVREMCLFSAHNLITDPPFSRLDLISCRNLLIYLEADLQNKLIPLCHYALRPGGFLFLGPSESVAPYPELFRAGEKRLRIFQAKEAILRPPVSFPLAERNRFAVRGLAPRANVQSLSEVFERILLEHYSPACVLVQERGEIVYFSPRTGRYLEPPAGAPRLNVLEMVRPGLRLDLRTALHKAISTRAPVAHEAVPYEADGQAQRVNLSVRPMHELGEDQGLYMVVFQDVTEPGPGPQVDPDAPQSMARIQRLESELHSTKDHLHATLEELESSNEELLSSNEELLAINEELQSTNEELQTSKEELQSVNEELETINAELKKKLEELDRANSDLQNLFQSIQIATIFVGRDLRIQRFTPAATEVFRLIGSDVGRRIEDIAPRFSGEGTLTEDIHQVLDTLLPLERQVGLREGDSWYILRILPYRTLDDRVDGVVVTFLDVTELKRAEENRARLAAIVESSHDAIIGKTLEGTVTSWNAGAERLYGYTAEEAVGQNISLIAPPERIGELGPIFERLRRGQRVEPFETVRVRKDGTRLNIMLVVSPVFDASGRIVEASAIAHDITAQKRTEEALHEAARRKDEFLAMLGHELRNPLAPIRNCLLILDQPGATPEQAGRARQTLERQVQHLTRLVDDLLDVSRISQGKILLRTGRLDMAALVRTAVEDYRAPAADAGETLELDLPDRPLWVNGDPTRLAQCVGNVLHNAVKFTERGGRIEVALRAEDGQAVVSVSDTGVGVDAQTLQRLFEPFSQADSGIDRSRGGLGLGLALVKRLVELHGGTASAQSEGLGHGTRVELRIPLQEARDEPSAPAPGAADRRRARRCLLIEDNADAAETMGLLLELYGHQVRIASDGREGLEAARRFLPEIVLCDIGLPNGLDGYEVARRMRQDPALRAMSLVALTGYGQEEDQRRAREAGFDLHLTKPADPEKLERLLAELP